MGRFSEVDLGSLLSKIILIRVSALSEPVPIT